jgi:hypothetical protein
MGLTTSLRALLGEAKKKSATELSYEDWNEQARSLLKSIESKLKAHATAQSKQPQNYGFTGDVQHVYEKLSDIDGYLSNHK